MKKIIVFVMIASLSLTTIPTHMMARTATSAAVTSKSAAEAIAGNALLNRLGEIQAMDKSNLNFSEKKSLRKEVRTIRQQLSEIGGGVYLSVGAIILIIILVIILL